jgi:hypothetical protein
VRLAALILAAALVVAAPAEARRAHGHVPPKRTLAGAKKRAVHRLSWRMPLVGSPAAAVVAPAGRVPSDGPSPPADGPAATGQPGAPAPDAPPAAPGCDPSPWLGVTAEDVGGFRLRLTRTCVPAGEVLFQFRNVDASKHNLFAEGVEPVAASRRVVDDTDGETTVTARAELTAGRWRLYCAFPGHEAMTRLVDVTPAG